MIVEFVFGVLVVATSWSPIRFRVDSFQVRLCFLNPPPEFLELVFLFEFEQSILQMKQLEYVEPWLLTTLPYKSGLNSVGDELHLIHVQKI